MVRKKTLIAVSLLAAAFFGTSAASAKKPRDDFFNPQLPGTRLKLDATNLLNTVNLQNPVNNLADPLFGRSVSAASPGRIIQVSGRVQF